MLQNEYIKKIQFNQLLILVILIFTLLSGSVRKWFTTNSNINAIVTAFQIPIVYLLVFTKGKSLLSNKNLSNIFIIYTFYLLISAFTPLSPSYYHAVSGFIIHLSFWLGLFIYITNKDHIDINRFFYLICIIILMETILAIVQYQLPRDNIINQYAAEDEFNEEAALSIAMVGDAVRVTGTFSYISGFSAFVLFVQLFSFSLFYNKKIKKHLPLIGIFLSLILAFITGSRSTTLINIILSISFFFFQLKDYDYRQLFTGIFTMVLILGINLGLGDPLRVIDFISSSYNNFDSRFETNKEEGQGRIFTPFFTIIRNDFPNKLIGNGLGISYPAVVAAKGTSKVAETFWVQDDEIGRTLLEGGYILLLLKLALIVFSLKNLEIDKRFMTITFLIIFIYMPLTTNIYNIVFFLMGIIYLEQAILTDKRKIISK